MLDVDRKLIAKILARRLELVLPDLISLDQTGFIQGRNSGNNIRRLLNIIQFGPNLKAKAVVVSLDAEKAFDRVEWSYLLNVLSKFNLGSLSYMIPLVLPSFQMVGNLPRFQLRVAHARAAQSLLFCLRSPLSPWQRR